MFINSDFTISAVSPPTPPTYIGAQWPQISELTHIQNQLYIDDTMTKEEFDARMEVDPNYALVVKLQGLRILVVLSSFYDNMLHKHWADIIGFLSHGLIDIEFNRCGEIFKSFDIQRLNIQKLLQAAHGHGEMIIPFGEMGGCCGTCQYPFYCDTDHTFSGMKICRRCGEDSRCGCNLYTKQGIKISSIYLQNCENEAHNFKFIYRT